MPGDEVVQDSVSEELQPLVAVSQSVWIVGGVGEGLGTKVRLVQLGPLHLEKVGLVPPHVTNHVLELVEAIHEVVKVPLGLGHERTEGTNNMSRSRKCTL